jgi:hypothetical protein
VCCSDAAERLRISIDQGRRFSINLASRYPASHKSRRGWQREPSIDDGDYDFWRARFGQTAGSDAALGSSSDAAVPEATASMMLFMGMLATLFRRRSVYTWLAESPVAAPRRWFCYSVSAIPELQSLLQAQFLTTLSCVQLRLGIRPPMTITSMNTRQHKTGEFNRAAF